MLTTLSVLGAESSARDNMVAPVADAKRGLSGDFGDDVGRRLSKGWFTLLCEPPMGPA